MPRSPVFFDQLFGEAWLVDVAHLVVDAASVEVALGLAAGAAPVGGVEDDAGTGAGRARSAGLRNLRDARAPRVARRERRRDGHLHEADAVAQRGRHVVQRLDEPDLPRSSTNW